MIRLMGALLTAGGGAFLGFAAAGRLTRRARVLRQMAGALEQMDREISFRLTPMPQVMERLGAEYPPPVGALFSRCCLGFDELGERSLAEIWRTALAESDLDLEDREIAVLDELGEVLGRFEESGLRTALARAAEELNQAAELARVEAEKRGRMYRVLGLAVGGLLVILLL